MADTAASSRVEWWELRAGDVLYIVAEWSPATGWEFWQKSTWEIRWHLVATTSDLVAKAQDTLDQR